MSINEKEKNAHLRPIGNRTVLLVYIFILLLGDLEACFLPITKRVSSMKAVRTNRSRTCCTGCALLNHLQPIDKKLETLYCSCFLKSLEIKNHTEKFKIENRQLYKMPEFAELYVVNKGIAQASPIWLLL